jgi:hypothetical protein
VISSEKRARRWPAWLAAVVTMGRRTGVIEGAARVGYFSRGAVYLSIGAIAWLKAAGLTPHARGGIGALRAWSDWPVGVVLLWLIGLGLCGFAAWRALQSVADIERVGRTPMALAGRLGKAVSGILYGTLGYETLSLLDTFRDLSQGDDQADTVASIHGLLGLPFGRSLVIVSGGLLLLAGLGNMVRACIDHFTQSLDCHPAWKRPLGWMARAGYFSRGVAFLPAGYFTMVAGWDAQPHEALSVGRALELIMALPFGAALLALQATGLIAFGAFGVSKAVYRRVDAAQPRSLSCTSGS